MVKSRSQLSLVSHMLDHAAIQALPELCDTSKNWYTHGNQEESWLKDKPKI